MKGDVAMQTGTRQGSPGPGVRPLNPGRMLVGGTLIMLGIIYLLDRFGVVQAGSLINSFWPVVIVAAGLTQVAVSRRLTMGTAVMVMIGVLLLAVSLNRFPLRGWEIFWPLVLIALGASFLIDSVRGSSQADFRDRPVAFSVFGVQRVISQSPQFRSGSLAAFFGGVTLDLRRARLSAEGADVDVIAAFGGIEVLVPPGTQVLVSGIPIFGGFGDKTLRPSDEVAPELRIRGIAFFGGVDAKS